MAPRSIRRRSPRPKPERRRLHFSPHHLLAHRSRRPRRAFAAPLWILHLRVAPHCHLPSPAARKPDHGCGDVHLLNEPSDRPLPIRGLQKKSTENIPLPLHLQTNLHVIDPWSSGDNNS